MATTSPPPPYSPGYPSQAPVPSGYGYGQQPGVQSYQPQQQQQTNVVVVSPGGTVVTGNCPICRIGSLHEGYTGCGILLAICFFPLGIICCLMMTERTCSHCGASF